jgi:hypothetical protein
MFKRVKIILVRKGEHAFVFNFEAQFQKKVFFSVENTE